MIHLRQADSEVNAMGSCIYSDFFNSLNGLDIIFYLLYTIIIIYGMIEKKKNKIVDYDERQQQNRLKAFRFGYILTIVGCFISVGLYPVWIQLKFYIPFLFFLPVAVGDCGLTLFSVITDSYLPLWDNYKSRFYVLLYCLITMVIHLLFFILRFLRLREADAAAELNIMSTNACLIFLLIIVFLIELIAVIIKVLCERKRNKEETAGVE